MNAVLERADMTNVWVVRAEFGKYTQNFLTGGYAAIGWIPKQDLLAVKTRNEVEKLYRQAYPKDGNRRVGTNVGQIELFLLKIKPDDYIITPPDNTKELCYGQVEAESLYYDADNHDECKYPHRRKIKWAKESLRRQELSVPFQRTFNAAKTVFRVRHTEEFLAKIGVKSGSFVPPPQDPYRVVIDQLLQLHPDEFEELIECLLRAIGFKAEVTGKTGDGGIDVRGEFSVSSLHTLRMFLQVKRWKHAKVSAPVVTSLRGAIPDDGQGAIITTSSYTRTAVDAAEAPGFKSIRLIDGHQLVDMLVEHWNSEHIAEFHEQLGLKPGLVLSG